MKKQYFAYAGMVVGLVLVILGIVLLTGTTPGREFGTGGGAPYDYDSGYAQFGADFYSYVTNNAARSASAASATAENVGLLGALVRDGFDGVLRSFCGYFLIGFGLLSVCFFGMHVPWGERKKVAVAAAAPAGPAAAPVVEPAAAPVAEPAAEPAAEPVAEAASESVAEAVGEPVAEPAAEPEAAPAAEVSEAE